MIEDDLPVLYRITVGKGLMRFQKNPKKIMCKLCRDTGSYTIVDDQKRQGEFELCQFCTNSQVVLHGRYQVVKRVGEGNFSSVFLAHDQLAPGSSPVALKVFHERFASIGEEEVKCLRFAQRLDRSGALGSLRFYNCFRHERKHIVIVSEALMTTDLFEKATTTPFTSDINGAKDFTCPKHISQLIYDLSLNLFLFHEKLERIHADIKPENVLLSRTERRFKLIDYGSSVPFTKFTNYHEDYELVSWLYRSPELLVGVPVTAAVDVWSLGCLIFEACARRPLCNSLDRTDYVIGITDILGPLPDAYSKGKFFHESMPIASSFEEQDPLFWRRWRASNLINLLGVKDPVFLDLMARMLDPNFETRITIREIFQHPFLAYYMPFGLPPQQLSTGKDEVIMQENQNPSRVNSSVDAEIQVMVSNMTPVKTIPPLIRNGKKTARKVPAVTGKRKTRSS